MLELILLINATPVSSTTWRNTHVIVLRSESCVIATYAPLITATMSLSGVEL
jgi:hypothetical protein